MRKALLAIVALSLSGCALKGAKIPGAPIPWADAGYTIMGKTTEEACGAYIFGIDFGHLFANQAASVTAASGGEGGIGAILAMLPVGGGSKEEARALYHALDKIPEATHLLDIRAESSFTGIGTLGFPAFGQRCATVHARGVKIDERPNPQQG